MIVDYYVDFARLASAFSDSQRRQQVIVLFARLLDICQNENGRLVLDEAQTVVKPLKPLLVSVPNEIGGLKASMLSRVLERLFNELPKPPVQIGNIRIEREETGDAVACPRVAVRMVRDVQRLQELADVAVEVGGVTNGEIGRFATFEEAFASEDGRRLERRRASYRDVMTFDFDKDQLFQTDAGSAAEFGVMLESFGRAERKVFEIFDLYGFKFTCKPAQPRSADGAARSLFRWIRLLLGRRLRPGLTVEMFVATKSESDMSELKDSRQMDTACKVIHKALQSRWDRIKNEFGVNSSQLRVRLHLTYDRRESELHMAMHDRRICSSTHSFSIGAGLDVLDKDRCLFELHYCGRRGAGSQNSEPRLKKIRDYFSNVENAAQVFNHDFVLD